MQYITYLSSTPSLPLFPPLVFFFIVCEAGSESFMISDSDSCYHFISDGTNLADARMGCEAMISGFHLVFIDSKEEQDFLASTSKRINTNCNPSSNCDYWIGIKQNSDMKHVWMDGSAIIYTNFNMEAPEGQCFGLNSNMDYVWEARLCQTQRPYVYICERERGLCNEIIKHACHALSNIL